MFEQELHKLKREELLEIMLAQSREIDSLTEELEKRQWTKATCGDLESGSMTSREAICGSFRILTGSASGWTPYCFPALSR